MTGVGRQLWIALGLSYLVLGLFALLLYDDLATSAVSILGGIAMLGLAFAVAWASGELATCRRRRGR